MLVVLVVALVYAPRIARMARAAALDIVTRDFVTVARLRGESAWSVMRRELLPNATSVLLVEFALRAGYAPVLIGSLGFLGFGLRPPTPEWGLMISENRALIIVSPITVLGPGLMLASLVVGLNLFTEGLARILGRTVRLGDAMSRRRSAVEATNLLSPIGRAEAGCASSTRSASRSAVARCFGLVGESGCGKSTVAYQLLGYRQPQCRVEGGRVLFKGQNLLALDRPELDRLRGNRISLVPQNPTTALSPGMRVGRQITEVLRRHGGAASGRAAAAGGELFDLVGLPDARSLRRRYPHQLRAASSSASASPWRLPASPISSCWTSRRPASTSPRRSRSSSLLVDLRARLGMSMLYVTHDLGVLAQIADRVGVMYAGRMVEIGRPATVRDAAASLYPWPHRLDPPDRERQPVGRHRIAGIAQAR